MFISSFAVTGAAAWNKQSFSRAAMYSQLSSNTSKLNFSTSHMFPFKLSA